MSHSVPRPYHRVVTVVLVLLNLLAIIYAIYEGPPGQRDVHFREASLISWLGSAQMLGAALLFLACFFASNLIQPDPQTGRRGSYTYLVFAAGFFLLALDQEMRLRDQLTLLIEGSLPIPGEASVTATTLKVIAIVAAMVLVFVFRATVLANFRMVLAFFAGFWLLVTMLLVSMLFESLEVPVAAANIVKGSSKLLALAMFLSASYAALLDRLEAAQFAILTSLRLTSPRRGVARAREVQEAEPAPPPEAEPAPSPEAEPEQTSALPDNKERQAPPDGQEAEPAPPPEAEPAPPPEAEPEQTSALPDKKERQAPPDGKL